MITTKSSTSQSAAVSTSSLGTFSAYGSDSYQDTASFFYAKIPGVDYDIIYNNVYQFCMHFLNIVEFLVIGGFIWCKTKVKDFVKEKLFGKKNNDVLPTTDDFHSVSSF
jgi:hypothetical protein